MNEIHFQLSVQQAALELQTYLKGRIKGIGLQQLESLFHQGRIQLNGQRAEPHMAVKPGDQIDIYRRYLAEILPEALPLEVIYEDEHLLVVNKAAGMPVHPGLGHHSGTLLHALAHYYQQSQQVGMLVREAVVHRLDKDTSGLMLLAKSKKAKAALERLIRNGDFHRQYYARVWGQPVDASGSIDLPIGRHPQQPKLITTDPQGNWGKVAITHYRLLESSGETSLLELEPKTGRTHQLRTHLLAIGHDIVGDSRYIQAGKIPSGRLCLHASRLELQHPINGQKLSFVRGANF